MSSSRESRECFVYITLPGETEPVTAARFEHSTDRAGNRRGRLVYGRNYLNRKNAIEIDPIELKLAAGTYETTEHEGLFGALRDAGPDHWGRRVIERHAGKASLDELDYLLCSPDDRAGALGFGLGKEPPAPKREFNQTLDLARLQELADALLADLGPDVENNGAAQVEDLLLLGTSMGGARPKAVVEDCDGLSLAKFNRPDVDRWNHARVDHAMLQLARECGLSVAESRVESVGDRDALLVKRFDREKVDRGYLRGRMISALTLLHADESRRTPERWSYILFAEELRRVSGAPREDAEELFRRMVFNALISNTDDHPRNHALLAREFDWRLSPAYDLTPTAPISADRRDLAMTCGDAGRFANAENLLSQASRFLLSPEHARATIDRIEECVKNRWYGVARAAGVSEADCERISSAFNYPGFGYPLASTS